MTDEIKLKERAIIEQLPQIPYIIDQVGIAMEWAKEARGLDRYVNTLELAERVIEYAKKSSAENFFKTHLVIAAILMDIPNALEDEKFETFKSASGAVENTLKAITISPEDSTEKGCFRSILMHMVPLAAKDEDCFGVMLLSMLCDLKEILNGMQEANVKAPITGEDYIKVLGYAFILSNLRMSNLHLLEQTSAILNEIDIILNNELVF